MYEWKITKLKYKVSENGLSNIIDELEWTYKLTQTVNNSEYSSQVTGYFKLVEPDANSFIPFSQITEEMVGNWIEESFGEGEMANLRTRLLLSIQEQSAPTVIEIDNPFG